MVPLADVEIWVGMVLVRRGGEPRLANRSDRSVWILRMANDFGVHVGQRWRDRDV